MKSESVSCSDELLRPCSSGADSSRVSTDSGGYATPCPDRRRPTGHGDRHRHRGPDGQGHVAVPTATQPNPRAAGSPARGPDPPLQPGAHRPGQRADGQHQPGRGRRETPFPGEHQRDDHLRADESRRRQAAQPHHRGQSPCGPQEPRRQQPRRADPQADDGDRDNDHGGAPRCCPPWCSSAALTAAPAAQPIRAAAPAGGPAGRTRASARQPRMDQQHRRHRHHRHRQEDPPPAQVLHDQAGHRRPDQRRYDPRRRERGEDPPVQLLRVRLPDHHVERHREQPGAETLHARPTTTRSSRGRSRRSPTRRRTSRRRPHRPVVRGRRTRCRRPPWPAPRRRRAAEGDRVERHRPGRGDGRHRGADRHASKASSATSATAPMVSARYAGEKRLSRPVRGAGDGVRVALMAAASYVNPA